MQNQIEAGKVAKGGSPRLTILLPFEASIGDEQMVAKIANKKSHKTTDKKASKATSNGGLTAAERKLLGSLLQKAKAAKADEREEEAEEAPQKASRKPQKGGLIRNVGSRQPKARTSEAIEWPSLEETLKEAGLQLEATDAFHAPERMTGHPKQIRGVLFGLGVSYRDLLGAACDLAGVDRASLEQGDTDSLREAWGQELAEAMDVPFKAYSPRD